MGEYTEIQSRVMAIVHLSNPMWRGLCGHPGSSMFVSSTGDVRCQVVVTEHHEGGDQCINRRCLDASNRATSKCRETRCGGRDLLSINY